MLTQERAFTSILASFHTPEFQLQMRAVQIETRTPVPLPMASQNVRAPPNKGLPVGARGPRRARNAYTTSDSNGKLGAAPTAEEKGRTEDTMR